MQSLSRNMFERYFKIIIILVIISLSSAIELSTQKLEISFDSPYNQNLTIKELLNFEETSFRIKDVRERNQFYRSVANSLFEQISYISFRLGTTETKLRDFIIVYEKKLGKDHFQFNLAPPKFNYIYKPLPLDQSGIDNDIYIKKAKTLKSQYIQLYKYYKSSIEKYKNYLFTLREDHFYENPLDVDKIIFKDYEFEELFYDNIQQLLKEQLMFEDDNKFEFMKVFRDEDDKVLSLNWFTNSDSLIRSRDFEYFDNGLLASIRERVGGLIEKETLYGQNNYSRKFYNFIFSSGFLPSHYNHMTEINYDSDMNIEKINFLKLNGEKIGSIEYIYNINKHLTNEVWRKGSMDSIIREFVCYYEQLNGNFRIIEKDKNGKIVYQDIVSSIQNQQFKRNLNEN